jgi:hypothetical protein
MWVAM